MPPLSARRQGVAASEPPNRTDRPATAVGAVLWDREVASPSRWTSREWARPASSSAFQRSRTPAVCIPALFPAPGPAAVPCALGAALAADTRHQHPAAGPAASQGPLPCPPDRAGRAGLAGQGWARRAGLGSPSRERPGPDGCLAPRVWGSRPNACCQGHTSRFLPSAQTGEFVSHLVLPAFRFRASGSIANLAVSLFSFVR